MANPKDIFDLVEAYLTEELSANELADFEARLSSDTALQAQLKKAQTAQKLVIQNRLLQVKSLANEEFIRTENTSNGFQKYIIGGGLAIITLVSGVFYLNDTQNEVKPTNNTAPVIEDSSTTSPTEPIKQEVTITNNPVTKIHTLKENTEAIHLQEDTSLTTEVQDSLINYSDVEVTPKLHEEKAESTKETKSTCNVEHIDVQIHTISGCAGKNENGIAIGEITGLKTPVKSEIFNNQNETIVSNYTLKDGLYHVVVSGAGNCTKSYPVTLKSKNCPIEVDFNPSFGETWNIPVNQTIGILTIYTKTGLEVIKKTIIANEPNTWDGKNKNEVIQTGYFIFTINYEDGSFLKGGITVTQ